MAIPTINKRIRRLVSSTPNGDLIVDLLPSNELHLGIKGSKKVRLDLLDLWDDSVRRQDAPPEAPEAPQPPKSDLHDRHLLQRAYEKVSTTVFRDDPKENYAVISKFSSILHDLLHPQTPE